MAGRPETSMVDPLTARSPAASGRRPWLQRWMRIVQTLGNLWAWILLTLFYLVVIAPIGAVFRLTADPLRVRPRRGCWRPLPSRYDRLEEAASQS